MSPRRQKTAVHWMAEGEALVRGTADPVTALGIAIGEASNGGWAWEDDLGPRPDQDPDNCPGAEHAHAADAAAFCFYRLKPQNHDAGWFRINPAQPGGDYTWMLGHQDGPGRGNFPGVLFDC